MQVQGEIYINKLILLFVFDKMEIPMSENTILDICCSANAWISYMDCKPILTTLLDQSLIYKVSNTNLQLYSITSDGRGCLADYFHEIPSSLRSEISTFVKNNKSKYRKNQECVADYYMNKDGSYTVYLKIIEPAQPLLELKFVVPNKQTAKNIYRKWTEKSNDLFALIYDNLVD